MICKLCNDFDFSTAKGSQGWTHLKKHHQLTSTKYYDQYVATPTNNSECVVCSSPTKFRSILVGYNRTCSKKCQGKDPEFLKKNKAQRKRNLENPEVRSKMIANLRKGNETQKKDPEFRAKMSKIAKESWSDKRRQEMSVRSSLRLKERWRTSPEFRAKIGNPQFTKGSFHSPKNSKDLHYRSSYELKAYEILEKDDEVLSYEVESVAIPYIDPEGKSRNYYPDILVNKKSSKLMIEVKPHYQLDDEWVVCKANSAKEWCKSNGFAFEFWSESDL